MMKKAFLLLFCLFGIYSLATAQTCTPDPSLTSPGIKPADLPDGFIGKQYNESITFRFPKDTSLNGITVNVDSVRVDSVANLTKGISYALNKKSAMYKPGENGCVQMFGLPTVAGNYSIKVWVTGFVKVFGSPVKQAYSNSVNLIIKQNTAIFDAQNVYNQSLTVYPNPIIGGLFNFRIPNSYDEMAKLNLVDLQGKIVETRLIKLSNGILTYQLNVNNLQSGTYLYQLFSKSGQYSGKLIVIQ